MESNFNFKIEKIMVDKTKKKSVIGTLSVITEDSESNESGS